MFRSIVVPVLLYMSGEVCPSSALLSPTTDTKCDAVPGAPDCTCKNSNGVIDLTKVANFNGIPRLAGGCYVQSYMKTTMDVLDVYLYI